LKKFPEAITVAILLALFAVLCWQSQKRASVTVDEFAHLPAGYYYWRTGDFSLYSKNPPLVKLIAAAPLLARKPGFEPSLNKFPKSGWLPWYFGNDFMFKNFSSYLRIFQAGRAMIIVLGLILGAALYIFARSRYGKAGALLSLSLFSLCPNMIGNSGIATVDTGASLFIFLALISLLSYLKKPNWKRTLVAGIFLGLAQLAKFSALSLLLFYFLAPFLVVWPFKKEKLALRSLILRFAQVAAMILIWIFLVAACYGFQDFFKPAADFKFNSKWMIRMQRIFRPLPAPFPAVYLRGLDGQTYDVEKGEFANYLLGGWYRGVSKKYFLIALLVKVPIPTQLLFIAAFLSGVLPRRKKISFEPEEIMILLILSWFFLFFSTQNSLQIGIRYLLPAFPLAFLFTGRMGKALAKGGLCGRAGAGILLLWLLIQNLRIYPHYLSYFNEYIGGPKNGHKALLESNIDWGQDLPALAEFMKRNKINKIELDYFGHAAPELYGINYQVLGEPPRLSYAAISVTKLIGGRNFNYPMLFHEPMLTLNPALVEAYQKKKPVAICGYSIWVFKND